MLTAITALLQTAPLDHEVATVLVQRYGANPDALLHSAMPLDPPDPDDVTTPPKPYDQKPSSQPDLRIARMAYRAVMRHLGSRPPEAAGALLAPKGSLTVTRFVPDDWGRSTPASFTFGTVELNRTLRPFIDRGEEVIGIVHSHPSGCSSPSGGDLAYLADVFAKNPSLQTLLFPIVEAGCLRPYLAVRGEAGKPVHIVEARLKIVNTSKRASVSVKPIPLDPRRIRSFLDTDLMAKRTVTLVGCGGGANLARNFARCNLRRLNLVDFDRIEGVNICRQEHPADRIGALKIVALQEELHRINPALRVECYPRNFCEFSDREVDSLFADTDLFIFAVDNLAANARGNEVALRLGIPALWSGLYAGGQAGEVVFWIPGLPCYRCLCGKRYELRDRGENVNQPAESADIFAVQYLDSVSGMVALGLLTAGADNGYGRLIESLGSRNFLQLKISPEWLWNGRDIIREQLRIPVEADTYFAWSTAARRDPSGGQPPCPDCVRFLTPVKATADTNPRVEA